MPYLPAYLARTPLVAAPRALTPEEEDALLAQGAGLGGGSAAEPVPAPAIGAVQTTVPAQQAPPADYVPPPPASGDANTASGSALYGAGGAAAYNSGYPVTGGTQPMGYIPADATAPAQAPASLSPVAPPAPTSNLGAVQTTVIPPPMAASAYYGGADPSAPVLQPGQWHSSLLYPARSDAARQDEAAREALMTDPTAIIAPDLRPLASAAGDWLAANVIEPFQRNSSDTSIFGVDVAPLLAPAPRAREPALAPGDVGTAAQSLPESPPVATPTATTMLAGGSVTAAPVSSPNGGSVGAWLAGGSAPGDVSRGSGGSSYRGGAGTPPRGFSDAADEDRDATPEDFFAQTGGNRVKAAMLANLANTRRRRSRMRGVPQQRSTMRDDILRAIEESLTKPPQPRR